MDSLDAVGRVSALNLRTSGTGQFDSDHAPRMTKRVLRPVHPPAELAGLSPSEQLQRAVDLYSTRGALPKDMPGTMRILGDAA